MLYLSNKNHLNIYATIKLNILGLPFKSAIKFPILVYGKMSVSCRLHSISIDGDVKTGMIRIGKYGKHRCTQNSIFYNNGQIHFGSNVMINAGCRIFVYSGKLRIGSHIYLGENATIMCSNQILINDYSRISWDFYADDNDGHYIINHNDNTIQSKYGSIEISSYTWVGNNVTFKKNSVLPQFSIVASSSLVCKNMSQYGDHLLIGGMPAKVLKRNVSPILNLKVEKSLSKELQDKNPFVYNGLMDNLCNENFDYE